MTYKCLETKNLIVYKSHTCIYGYKRTRGVMTENSEELKVPRFVVFC